VLAGDLDPAAQARRYVEAGARAVSVLTEPRHWGGSIADLAAVRAAVSVPVLAKDVVVDAYQVYEARAAGADAILLIAEALADDELHRLVALCDRLGMCALVEAHEPTAFGRAVNSGARVVGVNARNLRKPSEIDVGRVRQLHTFAHADQILVAESGIASADDVRMLPARVDAVLVGTALMRADDPGPLIHGIASIKRTVHA
jgi:indole-3-glycerol phosphate synthase